MDAVTARDFAQPTPCRARHVDVMHTKMIDSFSNKEDKDYFDSLFKGFGGFIENIDLFDFREP